MARRTKRPRVVWLPDDGFFSTDAATTAHSTVMVASDVLGLGGTAGETATIVAPVVKDTQPNPILLNQSLSDIYNSGYRLRRIVGKFWCGATQELDSEGPSLAVITAGFIVLRIDPAAGVLPLNTNLEDYSTNIVENNEAPWIWRRSWLISNNQGVLAGAAPGSAFGGRNTAGPTVFGRQSNNGIGGVADGPHIDAKTARIIGPDERLFLVITGTNVDAGNPASGLSVNYIWDLRVLVSLRTMVGNRRNASR